MTHGISTGAESLAEAGARTIVVGGDSPIRISTGHRLMDHEGRCSRPHGHNYAVTVTITGTLTKEGWVVDKGVVTDVIDEWDHRFLLEAGDPLIEAFEASGDDDAVVVFDHPPTAEVMAYVLEEQLVAALPPTVESVAVTVQETGQLCATHR